MRAQLDRVLVDGVLSVRPFDPTDRDALTAGRDAEFNRFLGGGSPGAAPIACVCIAATVVGWIDYDAERDWLDDDEVNIGYGIFAEHRRRGYATRALALLCSFLEAQAPPLRPTLLIDSENTPSLALATRSGFLHVGDIDGQWLFKPPAIGSPPPPAG